MTDHQTLKREHNKLKLNYTAAKVRIERLIDTIETQAVLIKQLQNTNANLASDGIRMYREHWASKVIPPVRFNKPESTSNDRQKTLTEVVGATGIEPVTPPV